MFILHTKRTLRPLIKFAIMLMFTIQALLLARLFVKTPGGTFSKRCENLKEKQICLEDFPA